MKQVFSNAAVGSLTTLLTAASTTVILQSGEGSNFPVLTGGDYFIIKISATGSNFEILKVTSISGDTLTVDRGQESTTATVWAVGAHVADQVSAGTLSNFVQHIEQSGHFRSQEFVPTPGQSVFTLYNPYPVGQSAITVSINGVDQAPSSFEEVDSNTVRIGQGLYKSEIVEIKVLNQSYIDYISAASVSYFDANGNTIDLQNYLRGLKDVVVTNNFVLDTEAAYSWGGLHDYIVSPTVNGNTVYHTGNLPATVIDTTANYDWTGTHTYSIRTSVNGNVVYDAGNITEAVVPINDQTGTSYTFVIGDASGLITTDNAAANTVTVPPNSSVAFPIGTVLSVRQKGVGQTTIVAGSGVTIQVAATKGLLISEQYEFVSLIKEGTDLWSIAGGLSA